MGGGIPKLAVIVLIVIALIIGIINSFIIKHISRKDIDIKPCVVDVWKMSADKSAQLSSHIQDKRPEELQKEIDAYLNKINQKLLEPHNYGCSFIAVKGSILGSPKDITKIITDDLR